MELGARFSNTQILSHSEILVSCTFTKRSMKVSVGSQNFVEGNVSNSLVLIFSTVLE